MRHTTIVLGDHTYPARDTGERWNGAPVLAFRADVMRAMVDAGDGRDANGEGLTFDVDGVLVDVVDGERTPVRCVVIDGASHYVPDGRVYDEVGTCAVDGCGRAAVDEVCNVNAMPSGVEVWVPVCDAHPWGDPEWSACGATCDVVDHVVTETLAIMREDGATDPRPAVDPDGCAFHMVDPDAVADAR